MYAIYKDATLVEDPFETASWQDIVSNTELGFDKLISTYRTGEAASLPKTFVGCERTITLTDETTNTSKDYVVQVIDEQADKITGEEDNYATLTFQFKNVINYKDDFKFNETEGATNKWDGSTLETSLKENGVIFNSIITPLNSNDETLLSSKMKSVAKKTHSSGTSTSASKLFIPSLSEIGVEKDDSTGVKVEDEGYTYSYYKNSTEVDRQKNKGEESHNYWLRSDVVSDTTNKNVWAIDKDGKASKETISTSVGVAPCFCLGKSDNKVSVQYSIDGLENVTWSDGSGEKIKSFPTTKNKVYSTFKKEITVPICAKNEDDNYKYEFKYWYIDNDTQTKITEDYVIKEHELVLKPYFEAVEKSHRESICVEATTSDPVIVSFASKNTTKPNLSYSTDGVTYTQVNWNETIMIDNNQETASVPNKIYVCSTGTGNEANKNISESDDNYTQIKIDKSTESGKTGGAAKLYGDMRSLLDYKNVSSITECSDYCFTRLFAGVGNDNEKPGSSSLITESHDGLVDASDLNLGVTKTGKASFKKLFQCAVNLEKGPSDISPTTLGDEAYFAFFSICKKLNYVPTIADVISSGSYAYYKMFTHCYELEVGPQILASKIADNGLASAFKYCTNLKDAPTFAETMEFVNGGQQFNGTFISCSNLVRAPKKLPAETLTNRCYNEMFMDCDKLVYGPEISATQTSVTSESAEAPLEKMFYGCKKLAYLKVHNTTWGTSTLGTKSVKDHKDWVNTSSGVISTEGLFECPEGLSQTRSANCIPTNWEIRTF